MLYRDFGKTGWKVSAVGLGTWNIGNQWGEVDDATAWATVRAALDAGVNLFDTAESYGIPNGLSEQRLGTALAGVRHRVYLVSKIGHWGERTGQAVPKTSVDMIRLCAHACLGRLRTDWIDVMLCHESSIQDPGVYLEAFESLKADGCIRAYGISTDSIEVIERFHAAGGCVVVEVEYSLINRQAEQAVLPYCRQNGIGVLIRGPLAKGMLSGRYDRDTVFKDSVRDTYNQGEKNRGFYEKRIAMVEKLKKVLAPGQQMVTEAIRFAISHPANPVAIPGAKSPAQAATNAAAGDRILAAQDIRRYTDALK